MSASMPLPAAVCLASALGCLYVALLSARLARAPGWKEQRLLAAASVLATVTIAIDLTQELPGVPVYIILVAARWQLVSGTTGAMVWLLFSRIALPDRQRAGEDRGRKFDLAIAVSGVAASLLSLIPGLAFRDRVVTIVIAWARATYRLAEPTDYSYVVFGFICLAITIVTTRFARAVIRGHKEFRWHLIGTSVLMMAVINDSLVGTGLMSNVLLLDAGYMMPLATAAMAQTGALVAVSRNLEKANEELERALAAAKEADRLADTDILTGIANRRSFERALRAECQRAQRYRRPMSTLIFDIDHFKVVNDTYGHPTGDAVIRAVAQATRDVVRATDISARIGGEEFAVILPETDAAGAAALAERLRRHIAAMSIQHDAQGLRVTVSLGSATWVGNGPLEPNHVMSEADEALYVSKRTGRDRYTSRTLSDASDAKLAPA